MTMIFMEFLRAILPLQIAAARGAIVGVRGEGGPSTSDLTHALLPAVGRCRQPQCCVRNINQQGFDCCRSDNTVNAFAILLTFVRLTKIAHTAEVEFWKNPDFSKTVMPE
ncbi:hypothetical protein [Paraburkholderia youngii]|uniref:hypothetical protein n=1 Tax=Paraburkholderia youngii TaxID=2782701 RepID=UPI0015921B01|nr:hypothetical protein [Paraburkholderia youngii]NUX58298.1 hypothetical protein [Paraburkholderia youngii]